MITMSIRAAQFAALAHKGQTRSDGTPYIYHPMRVAGMVTLLDNVGDEEIAAAWLHDTIEDCGVTQKQLQSEFNIKIAAYVVELTNVSKLMPAGYNRAERKKIDLNHIAAASDWAKRIKLADRIDNLSDMKGFSAKFRKVYLGESEQLITAIGPVDAVLCAQSWGLINKLSE